MWGNLGKVQRLVQFFFFSVGQGLITLLSRGQGGLRTTIREVWGAGPGHYSRLGVEPGGQRSPGVGFTAGV